jgi:hypothetical protein
MKEEIGATAIVSLLLVMMMTVWMTLSGMYGVERVNEIFIPAYGLSILMLYSVEIKRGISSMYNTLKEMKTYENTAKVEYDRMIQHYRRK